MWIVLAKFIILSLQGVSFTKRAVQKVTDLCKHDSLSPCANCQHDNDEIECKLLS